jgi:hypothetical protein
MVHVEGSRLNVDGKEWRNITLALGVTRRILIGLRKNLRKAVPHDPGHFCHEIRHFLPFMGQQVDLQLRMNRPLSVDVRACSADQHAQELDI